VTLLVVLMMGAAFAWPASAATTQASIQGSAYQPGAIAITAGDTITWTNKDVATHTVTVKAASPTFDSGNIPFNGVYTHTFNTAGSFTYHCTIHGFTGTLTVKAGATTTKPPAATTTTKPSTTTSTTAKPTTTTSSRSSTTTIPAATIEVTTTSASTTVPAGTATGSLPKHHDSAVGPLLAAIAVVLLAGVATAAYLIRQRRRGY
jgi:plastocyanin